MIEMANISVTYGKGTPLETRALRDVSLTTPTGEFLTIIGSNGAGKSTALNVIAGIAPVQAGAVSVDGQDITHLPPHRRARFVSRVFQDPKMGTCEDLTIIDNFALAHGRTAPRRFGLAIDRRMRDDVAARVAPLGLGLEDRLDDKVGLLSGGQRQAIDLQSRRRAGLRRHGAGELAGRLRAAQHVWRRGCAAVRLVRARRRGLARRASRGAVGPERGP